MSSDFRDAVRLSVSRAGAMLGVLTRLLSRATAAATFCACVSISAAPPKAESLGSSVSDGEICTTRPEPDTFACIDSTSRKEGEPFLSTPRSHTPSDSDSEPRRIGRPPVLGKDRDVVYYRAIVDPETGATSYVRFVRAERIPLLNAPDDWHVVDGGETGGAFDRRKFQRLVTTGWPTGTLRWLYNDSGRPSSLLPTANDAVHRIRLNMAKWQNVCGIRFVYDGVTSTPPSTANWMSDSFRVAAWEDLQSSVGGVVNTMTSGGQFVDADMRIDNVQVPSAGLGELDLVLLHEIGHWLGLAHSNVEGAVMSGPSAPPLISTTYSGQTALQADDVAGCVSLYGASPVAINVSVAPTDPFLGAVVVGQGFVDRVYTATNLQATAVTALGLEVAGRGFSLVSNGCGSVLAAGASCGFTVRFTTQQYGLSQGTITLFDSAYAWAKSISVTAAGAVQVSASLAVSPTVNATFPQTLVGAVSDSQTFRWTNLGATPTTISAISLSTADFQVTSSNCAGATLRSWEECEASVVFTPQSGGVRSATLSLNVSVGSVTGVSLSGVGDAISPAVCTLVSGLTNVSAAGGAVSYTATCSNVTAGGYLWKLDGATIAACTGSSCSVAMPANTGVTSINRVVSVSPTTNSIAAATASLTVAQAGASRCTVVSGVTSVPAAGGAVSYTATCSNVTAGGYLWKLDGATIAACTGSSCSVTMPANTSVTPVNRVVSVSPASDPIPAATASITVAQAGASRCTVVSGLANVSAAGGAVSYTATCSNVTAGGYLWKLDGAAIAACTGSSCSVAMPANTSVSPVNRVVSVSPASDPIPAATASLTVAQAGASRCTVVSGVTSVPAAGGAVSYTATCSNVTAGGYLWKLDGASIAACTGSSCSVTMPANTSVSAVDRVVSVSPAANPIPAATASITVAQAAAVACSLDFNGDGAMNASDSLLFTRWLLGFRGDALVSGITPYPAGTTTTAFATAVTSRMVLGLVHDFDNNTKVDAATDGLLLLRLTQGLTGTAVTNGALGVGALRNTHELIRTHVNSSCGTSFAAAPTAAPTPSLSINTDATSLSALGAVYPASTTYSFISGNGGRSAVKFNGVANPGAIRIPNTAAMQFNTGATIDLWARIDSGTGMSGANGLASTSGWAMALVAKSHDGGSVALNALANDSNAAGSGYGFGAWSSSVSGWGTGTCTIVNRNPGAALGTWFRLTAVASTTTGTRIYHNKQLIYSCPSAVPNFTGMNGQDLYIGRYSSVWYPLDGAVQDIRIYQQALTDAQVQALP